MINWKKFNESTTVWSNEDRRERNIADSDGAHVGEKTQRQEEAHIKTRQTNMRGLSHMFSFNPLQDVRLLETNGDT